MTSGEELPSPKSHWLGQRRLVAAARIGAEAEVATTTTDSQGHYSISVDPGMYSVDAYGSIPPSSGDSVNVKAGTTTEHDIVCSVP